MTKTMSAPPAAAHTKPLDQKELEGRYQLRPNNERGEMLEALVRERYPEDVHWFERSEFTSEIASDVACVKQAALDVVTGAENSFDGGFELACTDIFGPDNARTAMSLIVQLYHLEPRSTPLEMTPELAVLLVKPIVLDWMRSADDPDETDLTELVRDALAGRWDMSEPDMLQAIARAMQEIIVDAKVR